MEPIMSDHSFIESTLAFLQAHLALYGLFDAYEQKHELPDQVEFNSHVAMIQKHQAGAAAFLIQHGRYAPEQAESIVAGLCETWQWCAAIPWGSLNLATTGSIVREMSNWFHTAIILYEQKERIPPAGPSSTDDGPVSMEQHMQRVVQAVGDSSAIRILAIAQRTDLSGEQKMEEMLRLDSRFAGKDSAEWGKLLGVRAAAVRGYPRWKRLQELKRADS
jgi:hypothetical protein